MEKYIPLFPLNLVVFPEESLNLHIFEPRYKQLVNDINGTDKTFGIPPFINNKIASYGTEMQILSVSKIYEDGRMDIKTKGVGIFKLNSVDKTAKGKLYAGGNISAIDLDREENPKVRKKLIQNIDYLYSLLNATLDIDVDSSQPLSFMVAHKIGLTIEQEFKLLVLPTEVERQKFLNRHLLKTIPIIAEMERTKARISMNGHFKHLDPLDF